MPITQCADNGSDCLHVGLVMLLFKCDLLKPMAYVVLLLFFREAFYKG